MKRETSHRKHRKPYPRSRKRAWHFDEMALWKASLLKDFVKKHGLEKLTRRTTVPPGVDIGIWVENRRKDYRHGTIQDWLVEELESIPGWSWDPTGDRQRRNLDLLRVFIRRHGWSKLLVQTKVEGVALGSWVTTRRQSYQRRQLPSWVARALEAIPGWSWAPLDDRQRRNLGLLREFVEKKGWESLHKDRHWRGVHLENWVEVCRRRRRQGTMPAWLRKALEKVPDWRWSGRRDRDTESRPRPEHLGGKRGSP